MDKIYDQREDSYSADKARKAKKSYLNAVCRGSRRIGNHCGHCEKCLDELAELEGFGDKMLSELRPDSAVSESIKAETVSDTVVVNLTVNAEAIDLIMKRFEMLELRMTQLEKQLARKSASR